MDLKKIIGQGMVDQTDPVLISDSSLLSPTIHPLTKGPSALGHLSVSDRDEVMEHILVDPVWHHDYEDRGDSDVKRSQTSVLDANFALAFRQRSCKDGISFSTPRVCRSSLVAIPEFTFDDSSFLMTGWSTIHGSGAGLFLCDVSLP